MSFHAAAEWSTEELDVDAYLARVGYGGPTVASEEVLRGLHRAHATTIPFENLDIVLGREVRIDLLSMQDKLLRRCRDGYCFEHNLLFAAPLARDLPEDLSEADLGALLRRFGNFLIPKKH